ncbi:MAG: hypothetical protein V7K14_24475 [Nostoc sp.]|uniref:hypothetical protein n=1 Tax=unclassified Nostoc TaxID=2593658 RepID=UPI0025CCB952|nr:hypothetical protein [Nostoc sp. NMS7]MBN3945617.1 hypothetical protein [Nostoc sp. NMS7]
MQRLSCDIRKYDTSDTSYNIVYQLSGILEGDSDAGSLVGAVQGREKAVRSPQPVDHDFT